MEEVKSVQNPFDIRYLVNKYRQFIIYVSIGVMGLFWDFGGFWLLFDILKVDYTLANWISMSVAITHNFLLNSFFNFKKKDNMLFRFVSFYGVALIGIFITEVLLYVFFDKLGVNALIVKGVSLPLIALMQFILNKKITFSVSPEALRERFRKKNNNKKS